MRENIFAVLSYNETWSRSVILYCEVGPPRFINLRLSEVQNEYPPYEWMVV